MELRLKVIEGKQAGQEILIAGPKFLIGRGEECQLRPNSEAVSRQHCVLQVEDGRATVCDLGSRNGTLVNDQPVEGRYTLKTGDRLTIGQLRFEVQLTTGLKGQKQPIVKDVKDAAARTRDAATAEDLDVDSWLHAAEPPGATRIVSDRDTQKIELSDTSPGMDAATVIGRTTKNSEAPGKKPDGEPKPSGKLPPQTTAADGGSAAAEILRKLLKYR
jgi:pSer/pThr/pTyr-binding forkhead associated (FHA) protein